MLKTFPEIVYVSTAATTETIGSEVVRRILVIIKIFYLDFWKSVHRRCYFEVSLSGWVLGS